MPDPKKKDSRDDYFVDVDRMVNEGLGGGNVTIDNGLIEEAVGETLKFPDSVIDPSQEEKEGKSKSHRK